MVDGTFDRATFAERSAELRRRIGALEVQRAEMADAGRLEMEEGSLDFAERLLSRPADLWLRSTLGNRQRLQQALFPGGIYYSEGAYRTPASSSIFEVLRPSGGGNQRWWTIGEPDRTLSPVVADFLGAARLLAGLPWAA